MGKRVGPNMVSVLKQNWRDVAVALESLVGHSPIPPGHLYRSGNVDFCSHQELGRPRTILNLKAGADRTEDLPWSGSVNFAHLPAADNQERYHTDQREVRAWLIEVANFIADPHTEWPVLVHCRAGKDRTGVVVAMLLKVMGVPDHVTVEEYNLSVGGHGNAKMIERSLKGFGSGMDDYFRGNVDITALRDRLGSTQANRPAPLKSSASYYFGPGGSQLVEEVADRDEDCPWRCQISSCVGSTQQLRLNAK